MFLLRCMFWLGLALWQIALREGGDPAAWFAPEKAAVLASPASAAALCRADPTRCAAVAAMASSAATSWIGPSSGGQNHPAAKMSGQ